MSRNTYQKVTSSGKPVMNNKGLPIFIRSVEKRINTTLDMLTINMNESDSKWSKIGFNTKALCQ